MFDVFRVSHIISARTCEIATYKLHCINTDSNSEAIVLAVANASLLEGSPQAVYTLHHRK